ncbi:histidine phosphatase family protein [Kribbella italica]|uniref:Broad specificity phosphatase PhoE n=1 Tax=Kribbella italica TaxID=1540520 RepID=A0A7W9MWH9_9ACTN|nr:broad specificity phosphatase PhoE [Kribbella italica]
MTTTLTLVAHALTPGLRGLVLGGEPAPDQSGLEAAHDVRVDAGTTYCGPEPAAILTAEAMGFQPVVVGALRDREYGDWTGRDLEELLATETAAVSAWLERPHTAPPGGETANDLIARVADWLGDLTEDPGHAERRTVVAVVHPAVVRAAVLYALEAPAESLRHIDVRPLTTVGLSAHATSWSLNLH